MELNNNQGYNPNSFDSYNIISGNEAKKPLEQTGEGNVSNSSNKSAFQEQQKVQQPINSFSVPEKEQDLPMEFQAVPPYNQGNQQDQVYNKPLQPAQEYDSHININPNQQNVNNNSSVNYQQNSGQQYYNQNTNYNQASGQSNAYTPQYYPNQQYQTGNIRRGGHAGAAVLFWIIWIFAALVDFLALTAAGGMVSFVTSAAILVVLIVFRKSLYGNKVLYLITWVGAVAALGIIIAAADSSGKVNGNLSMKAQTNNVIANTNTKSDTNSINSAVDKPQPALNEGTIFQDNFNRPDSGDVGPNWQEFKMRNGIGNSSATGGKGDTPWSIKGNTLYYENKGDNTYTEDFIQTAKTFPINNTRVEFEIRAKAGTSLGYVGPSALWATEGENRKGVLAVTDNIPLIGVSASYRWENKGTKGVALFLGGTTKDNKDSIFSGLNQNDFAMHVIIIKDGKMTYKSNDMGSVTLDLAKQPEQGVRLHFSFGVRLYDKDIPQIIEIKNFKITSNN